MRIRNGFEEFFCLRSNLSNDNIISALRTGLKTGLENYIFWSEMGSGFKEPEGTPPPRVPRGTSPPRGGITCFFLTLFVGRGRLKRGRESIYSFNRAPSV